MNILDIDNLKTEFKYCWLWQYDKAPCLNNIIKNKEAFFEYYTRQILKYFISYIYNLKSANSIGIEVWKRILGAKNVVEFEPFKLENIMFYRKAGVKYADGEYEFAFLNNDGKFNVIDSINKQFRVSKENLTLSEDDESTTTAKSKDGLYKTYLLSRLLLYYMRGTLPEIQRYFEFIFPYAGVTVTSLNDMTYDIAFRGTLTNEEESLRDGMVNTSEDLIPELYGVLYKGVQNYQRWGFWDGDFESKNNKEFIIDETTQESDDEENYPFTYVESTSTNTDNLKRHGTNL